MPKETNTTKKTNEANVAEIVNDTDGGNQITQVTINFVFPFFCFYPWASWFPTTSSQGK